MLSLNLFHTSLTPCSRLSNGHFYCKRYSQLETRSWHKHFNSPILGAGRFSVLAQNCAKTLFQPKFLRKYFSRQWRVFLLAEIFHELFRVQMHIKVNILTRLSRVNNDPGWQNFWVVTNPGCPKGHELSQPQIRGTRHPLGVFRWIFQSRAHCKCCFGSLC